MANDAPDWAAAVSYRRQILYPDGVGAQPAGTPSFTIAAAGTFSGNFTLPPGCVSLWIMADAAGLLFTWSLNVTGVTSTIQYFGQPTSPGAKATVPVPTLPFTIQVDRAWDAKVTVAVGGDPTNATSYFVTALFAPTPPGQAGAAQSVTIPTPSLWQAPSARPFRLGVAGITAGTANRIQLIAGVAGQTIRPFYFHVTCEAAVPSNALHLCDGDPNTTGVIIDDLDTAAVTDKMGFYFGSPLTPGNGLFLYTDVNTGAQCHGGGSYSQGIG